MHKILALALSLTVLLSCQSALERACSPDGLTALRKAETAEIVERCADVDDIESCMAPIRERYADLREKREAACR